MNKPRGKFSANALLYLCAIVFFWISSGAFGMLQGIYIKELEISESFLGFILSTKILATAVFSIPCAMVVNKAGKKVGIMLAMLLTPLTIIFQGYFTDKWLILLFSTLQGGATAFLTVSEGPFFMENSNNKARLKLFSIAFADMVFSSMTGYFVFGKISGALMKSMNGVEALRKSIMISGFVGLIGVMLILFIKENKVQVEQTKSEFFHHMADLVKKKNSRKFLVYNFIIGFGAGLVVPYFNVYLKYKVHIGTEQIGIIMSLAQGAMGLGGLLTPLLAQKYGRVKTIIACQVVSIPFLMLIALPPSVIVVSIALFMRNGLMNMSGPVVSNLSMEIINDEERPIFASINNISSNLSRALSAVVAGFIMSNFKNGYEIPYFITAIMYIFATVYFYESFKNFDKKTMPSKQGVQA